MSNQESPAGKGGKWITVAVVVVLTVALTVCIVLLVFRSGAGDTGEVQPNLVNNSDDSVPSSVLDRGFVDESNAGDIMSELSEKVEEGMFECMMSATWTFEDAASASSNSYVANVESNQHALYFDVYEAQTDELLYSSPILPVGAEIRNVKLDKQLSAGDYDAVVMYTLLNEAYEEVSTVGFRITISVKK